MPSDYTTQLPYGTGTKTDTQINGTEEKAPQNPTHVYVINIQQRRQEYKMDKRQSLQ